MINIFSDLDKEDRALLERIREKDETAFFSLYDRYSSFLFGFLMRMIKSVEDAENILHDTMLEVWNRTDKYRSDKFLYEKFLFSIRARTLSTDRIKHLKKQSNQPGHYILPIFSEHVLSQPSGLPIQTEYIQSLLKKFGLLTEEEQQVLALAFYEGWTQSEIAKRLSIPAWTVNWSLRKSLNSIAAIITENIIVDDESHSKKYSEACAGYSVGVLQNDELKEFEMHLKGGCSWCTAELDVIRNAILLLPLGLPLIPVSPELKDRIQFSIQLVEVVKATNEKVEEKAGNEKESIKEEKIKNEPVPWQKEPVKNNKWIDLLILISLVASVSLNIYLWKTKSISGGAVDHDSSNIKLEKAIEEKKLFLDVLNGEKIDVVYLTSPKKVNPYFGKFVWETKSRVALLQTSSLPICSSDSVYTLWLITNLHNIRIGNFSVNQNGNYYRFQLPTDVAKKEMVEFVVTLEPAEGFGKPASQYLLRGKING